MATNPDQLVGDPKPDAKDWIPIRYAHVESQSNTGAGTLSEIMKFATFTDGETRIHDVASYTIDLTDEQLNECEHELRVQLNKNAVAIARGESDFSVEFTKKLFALSVVEREWMARIAERMQVGDTIPNGAKSYNKQDTENARDGYNTRIRLGDVTVELRHLQMPSESLSPDANRLKKEFWKRAENSYQDGIYSPNTKGFLKLFSKDDGKFMDASLAMTYKH